jgi:hypothetical protein
MLFALRRRAFAHSCDSVFSRFRSRDRVPWPLLAIEESGDCPPFVLDQRFARAHSRAPSGIDA